MFTVFIPDARFGVFSLLPNMLWRFGWHPGRKIFEYFGNKIEAKMGNRDLTFDQVRWEKREGLEIQWCIAMLDGVC